MKEVVEMACQELCGFKKLKDGTKMDEKYVGDCINASKRVIEHYRRL